MCDDELPIEVSTKVLLCDGKNGKLGDQTKRIQRDLPKMDDHEGPSIDRVYIRAYRSNI